LLIASEFLCIIDFGTSKLHIFRDTRKYSEAFLQIFNLNF